MIVFQGVAAQNLKEKKGVDDFFDDTKYVEKLDNIKELKDAEKPKANSICCFLMSLLVSAAAVGAMLSFSMQPLVWRYVPPTYQNHLPIGYDNSVFGPNVASHEQQAGRPLSRQG